MPSPLSVPKSTSGVISPSSSGGGPLKPVQYYGFSYRETSGSSGAVFRIRTGGASGEVLESVSLAAGESARTDYYPGGIQARDGLYLEVVSGAIEGAVRHG